MTIKLSYGTGQIEFQLPAKNIGATILKEDINQLLACPEQAQRCTDIELALDQPLDCEPLEVLASGKKVLLIIEDGTRSEPHAKIISGLLSRLTEAASVTALISCGSHVPNSERNLAIMANIKEEAEKHKVPLKLLEPSSSESSTFTLVGKTSRGTRVELNTHALDCELVVMGADMKNHYFAGYSNPLKNILPGISSFETIEDNHSLALEPTSSFGRHPFHPDMARRENPVAQDMLEAYQLFMGLGEGKQGFTLATISSGDKVLWTAAGDLFAVTQEGIRTTDALFSLSAPTHRYLVVSPGGDPQDESLYNAQRGLELTKQLVEPGGQVLLLAACHKGIAPTATAREFFYDLLKMEDLEELLKTVKAGYRLYSHKAYKFAEFLLDHQIHLHSQLPDKDVSDIHLQPVPDPQALINSWLEKDPEAKIAFVDYANKVVVHPQLIAHPNS